MEVFREMVDQIVEFRKGFQKIIGNKLEETRLLKLALIRVHSRFKHSFLKNQEKNANRSIG